MTSNNGLTKTALFLDKMSDLAQSIVARRIRVLRTVEGGIHRMIKGSPSETTLTERFVLFGSNNKRIVKKFALKRVKDRCGAHKRKKAHRCFPNVVKLMFALDHGSLNGLQSLSKSEGLLELILGRKELRSTGGHAETGRMNFTSSAPAFITVHLRAHSKGLIITRGDVCGLAHLIRNRGRFEISRMGEGYDDDAT